MDWFSKSSGLKSDAGFSRRDHSMLPPAIFMTLKAFPATDEQSYLELGNKVLLPQSILERIIKYDLPEAMIFKLQDSKFERSANVGVLEFIAHEGTVVLPKWLFQQLRLEDGTKVQCDLLSGVPKGKSLILQPHKKAFLELSDPKGVLENWISNYTCITKGDVLHVQVPEKEDAVFLFDVLDVQPKGQGGCIWVPDRLEVDFTKALDVVESVSVVDTVEEEDKKPEEGFFKGQGITISGVAYQEDEEEAKKENDLYDPRKHRIKHGLRQSLSFSGKESFVEADYKNRGPIVGRVNPTKK